MNVKVNEVYAFVANGLGGNKAGVVLDAEKLSNKQMQSVAHAVGAPETAFVLTDNEASYRLRFFTPTVEVSLCGHATIATWSFTFTQGLHKAGAYTQNIHAQNATNTIGISNIISWAIKFIINWGLLGDLMYRLTIYRTTIYTRLYEENYESFTSDIV